MRRIKLLAIAVIAFISIPTFAAYSNYNSVLLGQEAAGMGGAYTALLNDSSAMAFYNPAGMSRMKGSSISASVSAFQKLDAQFGDENTFLVAPTRVNKGFFEPVPSSAGTVVAFGHFALGFSILLPDFNTFTGEIEADETTTSFLSFTDQSLWVGGSFALNMTDSTSFGLSVFYTARQFNRTISDQLQNANDDNDVQVTIEEKNFTQNSLIYLVGFYHQISKRWSVGWSLRFPSIPVSGSGTFFRSDIDTDPDSFVELTKTDLESETKIPLKSTLGFGYHIPKKLSLSLDITYHGRDEYLDVNLESAADRIVHESLINFAVGAEYYFRSWLSGRIGIFSNFSSHPEITNIQTQRPGDHIDMMGFSSNWTFHTSEHTTFTFGGYWTGGTGDTVQQVGQELKSVGKSLQIFSMVVGSAYSF